MTGGWGKRKRKNWYYGQTSSHATTSKEKFQPLLTVVRDRCSWLLSTLGGPAHDHGRNSSHNPGVREEREKEKVTEWKS